MQSGVPVHHIGLLSDHPILQIAQHVVAVAAVGLRAEHNRPAGQAPGHDRRVAEANRVSDQDHFRQIRLGGDLSGCGRGSAEESDKPNYRKKRHTDLP